MLYRLYHQCAFKNGETDENQIGIYTDYQAARETAAAYQGKIGFRDDPDGFRIEAIELCPINSYVYCLYYECGAEDERWRHWLGCYDSQDSAQRALCNRSASYPFQSDCGQFAIKRIKLNDGDFADGLAYEDD